MLKHSARGGYRGSIPWPGRRRSQRTRSYRPVTAREKLPAISPHSVGRSTRRNRRLGDSPQMMIKRQEEFITGRSVRYVG